MTTRGLVMASLSAGLLASIQAAETWRTGRACLPTSVFVAQAPRLRAAAVGYLLLYNVMFIVPLVAILAAAYFGVRSETLGNLLRKRLALAKLGMAALFAALGVLVVVTI